jgi:nucleoside-diphosphate-sugar epimerase
VSRVLLTGASGFLGRNAVDALANAGHEVHAVARTPGPDMPGVTWHQVDLTDASAAEAAVGEIAAERLLHLAWYVEHGLYWQGTENVLWVEATLRLLRAFAAAGGRRAVLAGTCAEYDWSHELDLYDERTAPLAPTTMYGIAKHAAHLVAERFVANAGIELAWGRIFMPYGPGEGGERLVPSVIRALLAGEEAPVSEGRQARDFMYVEDVASAFAAILDSHVQGAINVASGRCCTIREMVTLIAEAVRRPELVRWGAVPTRAGEPPRLVADVRRLREEVGFDSRVALEDGVQRTVAWWRGWLLERS